MAKKKNDVLPAPGIMTRVEHNQNLPTVIGNVSEVLQQVRLIQELMAQAMKKDEHYGIIPGTKPTLLKPGAEKLGLLFHFIPEFEGDLLPRDLGNGHREYIIKCTLRKYGTDEIVGQGVGSCSTMETEISLPHGRSQDNGATCSESILGEPEKRSEESPGFDRWKRFRSS